MKKAKYLSLLAATLLLVGCGESSESTKPTTEPEPVVLKQKEIKPEEAKSVVDGIVLALQDESNWPQVPDEFTIFMGATQSVKMTMGSLSQEEVFNTTRLVSYSKTNNIIYSETIYNENDDFEKEQCWITMEGDLLHGYFANTTKEGVERETNTNDTMNLDQMSFEAFSESNLGAMEMFIEESSLMYSETPEIAEGAHLDKYEYYYGSDNAKSIQIEENLIVSQNDVSGEDVELTEGVVFNLFTSMMQEVDIKDYICQSFTLDGVISATATDNSIELVQAVKMTQTYSDKCEDVPTLDKTLWEETL